jgi:hypothetical protein
MFNSRLLYGHLRICVDAVEVTFAIQLAFLLLACLCSVIRNTSFCGTLPAMRNAAAKGTAQVASLGIGRLGEEENLAISTTFEVISQVRVGSKNRSQGMVVGQNGTANFPGVVPVGAKFVTCRDFY